MRRRTIQVLPILLPYTVPAAILLGQVSQAAWGFGAVVWIYLMATVLDVFRFSSQPVEPSGRRVFRLAIWMWPAAYFAALISALSAAGNRSFAEGVGAASILQAGIALGITGGMFGVVVAHELMHGSTRWERLLASVLMTILNYPHWCIEHLSGHHRHVGTPGDPATARLGESLYQYYPRAVIGGVRSVWQIERARLRQQGLPANCASNRVFHYGLGLLAAYAAVYALAGTAGVALFALQGMAAFSILEVINYIGHYGLRRVELRPGVYEPVAARHSWNADYAASNWLMFNVGLHADHHCHPAKGCDRLESRDDAPQLPAGYLAMFVLALIPPAWHWLMDERTLVWQGREPAWYGTSMTDRTRK